MNRLWVSVRLVDGQTLGINAKRSAGRGLCSFPDVHVEMLGGWSTAGSLGGGSTASGRLFGSGLGDLTAATRRWPVFTVGEARRWVGVTVMPG